MDTQAQSQQQVHFRLIHLVVGRVDHTLGVIYGVALFVYHDSTYNTMYPDNSVPLGVANIHMSLTTLVERTHFVNMLVTFWRHVLQSSFDVNRKYTTTLEEDRQEQTYQ